LSADVYLWHVNLDRPTPEVDALRPILSIDERERATRLRAPGLERRFVICRATLRLVLGKRLRRDPSAIQFRYSATGKPELADRDVNRTHFNVTHSGEAAKIAISEEEPVGIDLERIRPDFATSAIAERFFSVTERTALRQIPEDQRATAFFRCWTRKEAFVKAIGAGITFPLDGFDVSLEPGALAGLLAIRGDAEAARLWTICELSADPGYVAALAIARSSVKLVNCGTHFG
jgi:4'-phosphopantetheinyl transferase